VEAYLLFGSVVEPTTLLEGVFSLPPGHSMMVACDHARAAEPHPYWDFGARGQPTAGSAGVPRDMESAGREARPLLEQAVRSHLLADVPLGLFLSSGLDSTALAALAARERSGLHTFTIVFSEQEFSEAPLARATASRLGCEHRELLVSSEQMQAQLGEAVGALDQPSMDGINTFFVSWAARQVGLKVAISGLGGDEVFGGYPTFRATPRVAGGADPPLVARSIAGGMDGHRPRGSRSDFRRRAEGRGPVAGPGGAAAPVFFHPNAVYSRASGPVFSAAGSGFGP
jgi:asparagine synthase (glutamine-hydrolysing)